MPAQSFERAWSAAYERRGTGVETVDQQIRDIARLLGRDDLADSTVSEVMDLRVRFFRETLMPRPGAIDVLERLRATGFKLGLISDCSAEAPLVWPMTPFASVVDVAVFSCDVGCQKPDARIYRAAWEPLGVDPSECLFVGDGMSQELSGAQRVGMLAVQLCIEGEDDVGAYVLDPRESWTGPSISSLEDVLSLVSHQV